MWFEVLTTVIFRIVVFLAIVLTFRENLLAKSPSRYSQEPALDPILSYKSSHTLTFFLFEIIFNNILLSQLGGSYNWAASFRFFNKNCLYVIPFLVNVLSLFSFISLHLCSMKSKKVYKMYTQRRLTQLYIYLSLATDYGLPDHLQAFV